MDIKEYIQSGIIESYVMGLTDPEETALIESAMRQYPEVREAVAAFERVMEQQAQARAVAPPGFLKEKIKEAIREDIAVDSIAPPAAVRDSSPTGRAAIKWRYLAVAASILLALSAVLNVVFYTKSKFFERQYQTMLEERQLLASNVSLLNGRVSALQESLLLINHPGMKAVNLSGVEGQENAYAVVYWNRVSGAVYLMPSQLEKVEENQQYQLWAIVDGKPVDAGLIGACDGLCKMKTITDAQAFAITVEKKGGSPTPDLSALRVMGNV